MLTMFSITALAATNESGEEQGIISTGELSTDFDQLAPEQIEHFKKVMNGTAGLKTGEVQEVTTFEDGTVLYVTAIDENETSSATRSAQYDTRSFMFYTENWLGQKIDGFKVKMECYWNEDGMDSSIDNLVGTWTRYDNRFTLRWDDDAYVAQAYHSLGLNITHTSGNAYYIFSALINILLDPPECDIDYGAY